MANPSTAARRALKKTLRGPTQLQYAIASRIGLLNAKAWDTATDGASWFLSRSYLSMLETVRPSNIEPRYALVYDDLPAGPSPVAALHLQIARIAPSQLKPVREQAAGRRASLQRVLQPLKEKIDQSGTQRVLTCGNFLTYGQHGVAMASGADPALAWHAVAEVMYRIRHAEKIDGSTHFALIKDIDTGHASARLLEDLSYRYVETEPNMVLALDPTWKSHDDYLASLASKYRSGIRNAVMKPMAEAGCVMDTLDDIEPHAARLHALYKSVRENAGVRPFELPPDYFAALFRAAGDQARVSVVKKDNRIIGFLFSLADGDTGVAYHIGFDRDAAKDLPIYLRLLHAGIADAIALGVKRISFGRTALEPKASLGAKPEPYGVLIRHRQPVLNKLIKHVLLGIEHAEAPERNPFKRASTANPS